MKKIFCKKTLSAFLAAVMILAMIPVGMISAVAATAGTDYDLGENTITIKTVDGWKYVSANAATYAAYDVILGASLDFKDATEYGSLFGATTFTGTLDGKGNTIKNFSGAVAAIIANVAQSTAADKLVVVKDVNFDSVSLTSSYTNAGSKEVAGTIFADVIGNHPIKVNSVNISANITVAASNISIGGVIGSMSCNGGIQIEKVTFSGELKNTVESDGAMATGGIVGESRFAVSDNSQASVISKCHINANLINRSESGRASGIAGFWGRGSAGNYSTDLVVEDCYLQGIYSVYKGKEKGRTGAVLGQCQLASGNTVTLKNIVSSAALDQYTAIQGTAEADNTVCTSAGYLVSYGSTSTTYNVINCVSTVTADKPAVHNNDSIEAIKGKTSAQIASLVSYDANGFINGVAGTYGYVGDMEAQVSNVVDGKYIIRFVMPAMTADMTDVKMTIVVKNGEEVVHTYEIDCIMWDYLTGYNGRTGFTTYTPDQYGADKLLAGAIVGVPTGAAYDFEISTTFTINGVEITSTAYGASVTAQGALVTE